MPALLELRLTLLFPLRYNHCDLCPIIWLGRQVVEGAEARHVLRGRPRRGQFHEPRFI